MKPILIGVLLMITPLVSFSQDCNKEILRQKPGTWKTGPQGSINNVTATDLTKEKAVVANIHKMISTNHKPTGCEIQYNGAYGKQVVDGENWVADPYHYSLYILRYLCDNRSESKYYVDYSTPTTVTITSNVMYWFNLYGTNLPPDDFRGYLKLKQRPEKKDGIWFMGDEIVGDYGTPSEIKESRWLITYNEDALPFYYVTRKEYLLIQKKRLEKHIQEVPSDKEYMSEYLSNVNEFLKKSDAELSLPAICMWNDEERFEKFVEEGTRGSFFAVKPNLNYYKKLPKSTPQFFTVVYKISKGDPVFADNYDGLKKAVDLAKLKDMLGK